MFELKWRLLVDEEYTTSRFSNEATALTFVEQIKVPRDTTMVELFKIEGHYEEPVYIQLNNWWPVHEDPPLPKEPTVAELETVIGGPKAAADMVNHPAHYQSESGLEVVDCMEAFTPDCPHKAQALIYICRARRKHNESEDLRKAIWWLKRRLSLLGALDKEDVSA